MADYYIHQLLSQGSITVLSLLKHSSLQIWKTGGSCSLTSFLLLKDGKLKGFTIPSGIISIRPQNTISYIISMLISFIASAVVSFILSRRYKEVIN